MFLQSTVARKLIAACIRLERRHWERGLQLYETCYLLPS